MGGSSSTSKNSAVELEKLNDSIYIFRDPVCEKKIKALFIFFHDILWPGHEKTYLETWMSSGYSSVCWPKAWLSTRYPDTQILYARYNASLWKQRNTGHIDIELIVETLWQDILSVSERNYCPIFLIGHGLGGIVMKAIIRAMQYKRDALNNHRMQCNHSEDNTQIHRLDCFLKNVKGVFYYDTPFHGLRLVKSINFPRKGPLAQPLEVLSTYTCRLNEFFRYWRSYRSCKAKAILALLPTKVTFWYGDWCTVVVEEASARSDIDDFYSATERDHFTVCKPQDDNDSSFRMLVRFLDDGMQGITDGPHAHIEDTQPRRQCIQDVETILSELHNLRGDGLKLNIVDLKQLEEFKDIWSKLINGLKDAGYEKTGNDGDAEQWELEPRSKYLSKYFGWEPGYMCYDQPGCVQIDSSIQV